MVWSGFTDLCWVVCYLYCLSGLSWLHFIVISYSYCSMYLVVPL